MRQVPQHLNYRKTITIKYFINTPRNCDSGDDFHNNRNIITVANIFVSLSVINCDLHERILSIQGLKTSVTDVCVEPEAFIFLQRLKVCFLKKIKSRS